MKQKILQIGLFFFTVVLYFQAASQVTITKADFPRSNNFIDSVRYVEQTGLTNPVEGADQFWDYSALLQGELRDFEFVDATNDVNFQGALNSRNADLNFQGFLIKNQNYEAIDANGLYDIGRSITKVTYPIRQITGGPNDSLSFVGKHEKFVGRINDLQFPMSYQDTWTGTRIEYFDFELTVAAFGLNKTPGFRKTIITETREVVGYGGLVIPKRDGTPSSIMDVLLVKANRTRVDSIYLGGAPAPAVLLGAFGLTQGVVDKNLYYNFYRPGYGGRVLDIGLINSTTISAFYRPQAAEGLSSVNHTTQLAEFNHFPNPVAVGQSVTLRTDTNIGSGMVNVVNVAGQLIFQTPFDSGSSQDILIDIPNTIRSGMYLYHVVDQKGLPVGAGKLVVE